MYELVHNFGYLTKSNQNWIRNQYDIYGKFVFIDSFPPFRSLNVSAACSFYSSQNPDHPHVEGKSALDFRPSIVQHPVEMKIPRIVSALAFGLVSPLLALEPTPEEQEVLRGLFSPEQKQEQLITAVSAAKAAGFSDQILLEARLVWGLRNRDVEFLVPLIPELDLMVETFDPDKSAGIRKADEFKGLVSYVKALEARKGGDAEAFKQNILEAFWLHPPSAQLYAQAIGDVRREARLATLELDLSIVITNSIGEATTLKDQMKDHKALLVDFWASWCGPCMALMPELQKKADQLAAHGIVVAGMNTDSENAEVTADAVRRDKDLKMPWLVEPAGRPYSKALDLESIPAMALITPDGKVSFFGHPQEPALWEALKKIDPEIKAPDA